MSPEYTTPSTVSHWLSVGVGFYRVCVIDRLLAYSPAGYVRRPPNARRSTDSGAGSSPIRCPDHHGLNVSQRNDFALIAMLGLPGLRIFEACGANIADLGEEHGRCVL